MRRRPFGNRTDGSDVSDASLTTRKPVWWRRQLSERAAGVEANATIAILDFGFRIVD